MTTLNPKNLVANLCQFDVNHHNCSTFISNANDLREPHCCCFPVPTVNDNEDMDDDDDDDAQEATTSHDFG